MFLLLQVKNISSVCYSTLSLVLPVMLISEPLKALHMNHTEKLAMLGKDIEWETSIAEASQWRSGDALRHLFVLILIHCAVADCTRLFEISWHLLAEGLEMR